MQGDVTEPESGSTAITDANGSYTLKNVLSSKMVTLQFAKAGEQLATGRVDLANRRSAIADFDLSAKSARLSALTIIPSVVVVNAAKARGVNTRALRGVVRDARGAPLSRALVSLKGIAMARTDSQGQYVFMNVPAGTHQVTVQRNGLEFKAEQVQVTAKRSSEAKFRLSPNDQNTRETGRPLSQVTISVSNQRSVVTDQAGLYTIANMAPGVYQVSVRKDGYSDTGGTFTIHTGATATANFKLIPRSEAPIRLGFPGRPVDRQLTVPVERKKVGDSLGPVHTLPSRGKLLDYRQYFVW